MKNTTVVTPSFKAKDQAQANIAINFLLNLRKIAAKEKITATAAVQQLYDANPKLGRAVVYKSAVYAGINLHTACNAWDKARLN